MSRARARPAPFLNTVKTGTDRNVRATLRILALPLLSVFQFFSLSAFSQQPGAGIFANTPIKNFSLPFFNDDSGYREFLVRGNRAIYVNASRIDIEGLEFTQFFGDGSANAKTRLTAPTATLDIGDKQAPVLNGKDSVRLAYENDLEATGEDWAYDHARKKITINRDARIVYKSADDALRQLHITLPKLPVTPDDNKAGDSGLRTPDSGPKTENADKTNTIIAATALTLTQNADGSTFAVFTGSVTVVTADDLRLACDRLEVTATNLRDKNPAITPLDKFQLLVATGNVRLTQGARTITCGRADVLPREDRITLTQNAAVADAALRMTATGDPLTLHRADRRIEGKGVRITLPPLENTDAVTDAATINDGADGAAQSGGSGRSDGSDRSVLSDRSVRSGKSAQSPDTVITASDFVMWETPDNLTHATLEGAVVVEAADLALACEHLELTADSAKPAAPVGASLATPAPAAAAGSAELSGFSLRSEPLGGLGGASRRLPSGNSALPDSTEARLATVRRLLATRNVRVMQGAREVACERAEVLPREDIITLTENPVLTDHVASATATGDVFTLRRVERRVTGENVRITLPPLDDLSALAAPKSDKSRPDSFVAGATKAGVASDAPTGAPALVTAANTPTTITAATFAMWQPDGDALMHATFDDDVHVAATNLALVSDHLALSANPAGTQDSGLRTQGVGRGTLDAVGGARGGQAGGAPTAPVAQGAPLTPEEVVMARLDHALATGRVHFTQLSREAFCERAEIFPREDRITLTGKPVITDSARQITATGDKLTLIRGSQEIQGENVRITTTPAPQTGNPKSQSPNPK